MLSETCCVAPVDVGTGTHRAVEGVVWEGDVMVGHYARYPASVLGSPQDAVEVWEILENVITFFSPVAQCPVSHL